MCFFIAFYAFQLLIKNRSCLIFMMMGIGIAGLPSESYGQQTAEAETSKAFETLYELGYFEEYAENTSQSIKDIVVQLTEQQQDAVFVDIIAENFEVEAIRRAMRKSIERSYQEAHGQQSAAHLRKPEIRKLMRQLYASEVDLEDAETKAAFEAYSLRLDRISEGRAAEEDATRERIALMADILNITRRVQLMVQGVEEMLAVVIFAINQSRPVDEQLGDQELNNLLLTLRANFRAFFEDIMLYVSLYSTRELSIESLKTHLEFLRSDSGQWFVRTYNNAVLDSFSELGDQVSEALARWAIDRNNTD